MKQLTRFEMAAVKRTAQNTKPIVKKLDKVKAQIVELGKEMEELTAQISVWETPIMNKYGYTSAQILDMEGNIPENTDQEAASASVSNEESYAPTVNPFEA